MHFFECLEKWDNYLDLLKILQRRFMSFWDRFLKVKLGMLSRPGILRFFNDLMVDREKKIGMVLLDVQFT